MKNRKAARILSALLAMVMTLSSVPALADLVRIQTIYTYTQLLGEPSESSTNNTLLGVGEYMVNSYNDSYYKTTLGDDTFYIRVSDVQTLERIPTQDTTENSSGSTAGGNVSAGTTITNPSLLTGENDETYSKQILNFTVTAAGLFLYPEINAASPTASIAAGNQMKLTYVQGTTDADTWYSTWYNNQTYYVKKSDLTIDSSTLNASSSFSLKLEKERTYYSELTSTTDTLSYPTGFYGKDIHEAGTLPAGSTLYVTVAKSKTVKVANEVGEMVDKTYPTWYSFETAAGVKRYFQVPDVDDVIKNALSAYEKITASTRVPFYATAAEATKAVGAAFIGDVNVMNPELTAGFEVYSSKPTTTSAGTLATPATHMVVYDLQLDTTSKQKDGSYTFYKCTYVNANGQYMTGYVRASDVDIVEKKLEVYDASLNLLGTTDVKNISSASSYGSTEYLYCSFSTAVNGQSAGYIKISDLLAEGYIIEVIKSYAVVGYIQPDLIVNGTPYKGTDNVDYYNCTFSAPYVVTPSGSGTTDGYVRASDYTAATTTPPKTYATGGLLADSTNTSYWPQKRAQLFGQIDAAGGYNRITSAIVIEPKSIADASVSGWKQADYRDGSNNFSSEGKTTYPKVYFKSDKAASALSAGVNVFSSITSTSDLEHYPSGWYGTAANWQGLYSINELTNKSNYKTQTRTVGGDTEYRVSWFKVQYVNYNGTVSTGYYENTDTTTWTKLTNDAETVGGTAYNTTNASGADTGLLKALYGKTSLPYIKLYTEKSKLAHYYGLNCSTPEERKANVLYGVKSGDEWYQVIYNGKTYYVLAAEVDADESVAVSNGTLTSSAFYITIGSAGGQLYSAAKNAAQYKVYHDHDSDPTTPDVLYVLPAGYTVLVSQYNSGWYTYRVGANTYYIPSSAVAAASADGTENGYRVILKNNTKFYKQPGDATHEDVLPAGYYAVQSFNAKYYAIRLEDGRKYYFEANGIDKNLGLFPVTTTGKSYSAVVGGEGARLFKTESAAVAYGHNGTASNYDQTIEPGSKITVKQVYSYLYLMTTVNGNRYISIRDLSTILGGDDDQYKDVSEPSSGVSASDVLAGKTDEKYTDTVISYTTPASGLWLYSSMSRSAADFSVKPGVTLNLSAAYDANGKVNDEWFATWSNNKQYYVLASDLQLNTAVSQGSKYTITLKNSVNLYSQLTTTTNAAQDKFGTGVYADSKHAAGILEPGTYNVTAYKTLSFNAFENGAYSTVQFPAWYSYVTVSGTTVYFQNPELATVAKHFDRTNNAWKNDGDFGVKNAGTVNATKLYLNVSRDANTADGSYNANTTSAYVVYAGLKATDTYSGFYRFQYDNNYDPTATNGWRNGRTANNVDHRQSYYNDPAWDRVVNREQLVDIKPYLYTGTTAADGSKSYVLSWYQGTLKYNYNYKTNVYDGSRTVYFMASDAITGSLTGGTLLNAAVTSGSNVNFTLSVPVARKIGTDNMFLYASPSNADDVAVVKTQVTSNSITYLPGISYNDSWYKVVYNNEGWYVKKSDVVALGNAQSPVQDFSEGKLKRYASNSAAAMQTYAVTIGTKGARLYSKPSTNSSIVYKTGATKNDANILYDIYEQNAVVLNAATKTFKTLTAGQTISAAKYDSNWYIYGEYGGDGTLTSYYFRAADVANSNDTSSVDSYVLTISAAMAGKVMLHSTKSDLASNPNQTVITLPAGTYTARKVDATWSRVTFEGKDYYFKTNAIEGVYTFTVGDALIPYKVRVWSSRPATVSDAAGGTTLAAGTYTATKYDAYFSVINGGTFDGKFIQTEEATGRYQFTTARSIDTYSNPELTGSSVGTLAINHQFEAIIHNATVSKFFDGTTMVYFKTEEATMNACTFSNKAELDLYNAAKAVVFGADSGNGLPIGNYPDSTDWKVVKRVDNEWISLRYDGTTGPWTTGETYYVKASDITKYQQIAVTGGTYVTYNNNYKAHTSSSGLMTNSELYLYDPSRVSTGATTQTAYLNYKLGTLTDDTTVAQINTEAGTTLAWSGEYNKATRINDKWGSVVIPNEDPLNGRNYSYSYDPAKGGIYKFTQGTTKNAGKTLYFFHDGAWTASAGSVSITTGNTAAGNVTNAMGAAIATVKDGKTYTITIGAQGAKVYNNAKLLPDTSTSVIQTIQPGTTMQGVKLTAAYETTPGVYAYQPVYKILYNGYTAYIDAADVAGVAVGEDAAEREAEKNQNAGNGNTGTGEHDPIQDSSTAEPLDLAVGDPAMNIVLAKAIAVYTSKSLSAVTMNVPAGTGLSVTRVDDAWYRLLLNGVEYYIPVTQLTMEQVSSTEKITDGVGYITKMLSVAVEPGSTLNLRKTASTGSTIMAYLKPGTYLTNMGYTTDANNQIWYKVSYNGTQGYVFGTYVEPVLSSASNTNSATDLSVNVGLALSVNTDQVYVRKGAGPNYDTIDRLQKYTIVVPEAAVTGADGLTWYQFTYNGQVAYIRYDYLTGGTSGSGNLSGNAAIRVNSVNLRSGAGTSFQVLGRLNKDDVVTIIATSTDTDGTIWYRVTFGGETGYVRNDLLRSLTTDESSGLINSVITSYKTLKVGSRGSDVTALQRALIQSGNLPSGEDDGIYGPKTMAAVQAFQNFNGISPANGVADPVTQAKLFGTGTGSNNDAIKGNVNSLDWFGRGYDLINAFPNVTIYDCNTGVTWNAKYINGKSHADIIPASSSDAQKLTAYSITGDWVRRPVIVTINGVKYAGSMYAVGHGTTNYCSWFSGVMCIHFTGSKGHSSGKVDSDHQAAIQFVLANYN